MKIYDQPGWKALKRKGGAHADMVSEGFANFIAMQRATGWQIHMV